MKSDKDNYLALLREKRREQVRQSRPYQYRAEVKASQLTREQNRKTEASA